MALRRERLPSNRSSPRLVCALGLVLIGLAGCTTPDAGTSPLRLPTRVLATPTSTPLGAESSYELALARRAAGDTYGALDALSQALAADANFAPAYVERASVYLALDNLEAALADAQAAVTADPENPAAHVLLGEVLRRDLGDPARALSAYERAVALDPSLAEATFPDRWWAARAAGQATRMIGLAREYEDAHPDDPLAAYYQGRALTAVGLPRSAIATLVDVLDQGGPAALWFALGEAYEVDGSWSHAQVCYEQARALAEAGDRSLDLVSDTPVPDLFVGLGEAYLHVGECSNAIVMLEYALVVGPDRPEVHTLLGRAMICQTPTPTPTPYPWLSP